MYSSCSCSRSSIYLSLFTRTPHLALARSFPVQSQYFSLFFFFLNVFAPFLRYPIKTKHRLPLSTPTEARRILASSLFDW